MSLIGSLLKSDRRGSVENPSTTLADPANWLFDALGGEETASGIRITEQKALALSAFWKGVNLIAGAISRLPCYVYRRTSAEDRDIAADHPAYYLLRWEPSSLMTAPIFWAIMTVRVLLRGNAYAWIEANGQGPIGLVPLQETVKPKIVGAVTVYEQTTADGLTRVFREEQILHLRGPGDLLEGWSAVRYGRESMGGIYATNDHGARFWANATRASTVLEHPGKMDPERARATLAAYEKAHSSANVHKTALLMEGMKAHQISFSNEDSQYIETKKFGIIEVSNWLNIPPHMLGDESRKSYASLEQENQSFLDHTLDPRLVWFEAECRRKLLTEDQKRRDTHFVEFMREAIVRANLTDRGNFYNLGIQGGWLVPDQIARTMNMPPLPNNTGKWPRLAAGVTLLKSDEQPIASTISPPAAPTPTAPAPAAKPMMDDMDEEPARELIHDLTRRAVRRIWAQAERHAKSKDKLTGFIADKLSDDGAMAKGVVEEMMPAARLLGKASQCSRAVAVLFAAIRKELFAAENLDDVKQFAENAERVCCEVTWGQLQEASNAKTDDG